VNDGICGRFFDLSHRFELAESYFHEIIVEPECCDGSDEYSGLVQCPNVCDVVEKTYRQKMKELADLHAMVLSNLSMMILYVMKFITKLLCDQ